MNGNALLPIRLLAALLCLIGSGYGAEVIPPKPARYFNDFAGIISKPVQERLNSELEALEKSDSTQIVVAIFKKMQSESSIEDYTVRVAEAWGVGQKRKNNGAVLFIFIEDRQMFLQTGYGIEGAIPDAVAKDITENRIKPQFKNGNYDAGAIAGVEGILQAARGEYKGTGQTVSGTRRQRNQNGFSKFAILLFFLFVVGSMRRRRGHVYGGMGRRGWGGPIIWPGGGGWGGGGGMGSGGGFSGGGGSFGGGGAGSKW